MFEEVREDVGDERIGIGRRGVERLNEGAATDRASVGLEEFAEIIVGADDDGAIFHGAALAADGDLGLGFGLIGIARWVVVEALVEVRGGGEEALALLRQGLDFSIDTRGCAIDVHGYDGVDDGLVARVVNFQHDIRAERLDGIEEDGAGVNAEVAGAGVEDDEVLLQIHRATCEDAGAGADGKRGGFVADLDLVEETTAGQTADHAFEAEAAELGVEGVAYLMRREKHAATAVDADRVGELEIIVLNGVPDFHARQLGCGRRVEEAADGGTDAEQFLPVGGVGKTIVIDEGVGFEFDAVAGHVRRAGDEHLEADAGQRAALSETQARDVRLEGLEFGRVAWPEG